MKRILSIILTFVFVVGICVSAPITITANAASVSDLTFELNEDGQSYYVIGCSEDASGEIVIPGTYNSLPVTSIGYYAFSGCASLTSITIPDSVTSIDDYVFEECTSLTSITIPDSITSIGWEAFSCCTSLSSVYITDIASWCNIDFGYDANPLFNGADLYLNGELVTELTIPESVTEIKGYVFWGCDSLTSVTIPDSVTSIGNSAFEGCSSLTSITIPDGVTSIGWYAFDECTSLKSVTIPDNVTSIGDYAFGYYEDECCKIEGFTIHGAQGSEAERYASENGFEFISNGSVTPSTPIDPSSYLRFMLNEDGESYSVTGCSEDASGEIVIPGTYNSLPVTSIGSGAFWACTSLTSITIPDSVTSIGEMAFYECTSLSSVYITDIASWCNIE
ncbi:MAG: leucine-rich repeat domain-containing protein, partial [Clostridia bacterium]|nr:leucine-rich repeat domain-containing protein [Clostridia bacterium]